MPGEDWEYQVRHRAYELWNAAGRPDGKHQQFWEAAERELKRAAADERQAPPGPQGTQATQAAETRAAGVPPMADGPHRDPV